MPSATTSANVDVITLEIVRNALPAVADEMSSTLQRTSYNVMIYEVRDYCTALVSPDGDLIAQNGGGVSHFVADLGVVVRDGVERYGRDGFRDGDVVLTNHQAVAGQHLNNVVTYSPVMLDGELVAFSVVRAHWVDVGGFSTGFGGTGAFDPWSEGLQFDQLKVYEAGEPDEKLLRMIRDNIRYPEASMGDLRAQVSASRLGNRRYVELLEKYGRAQVEEAITAIYADTEQRCRAAIAKLPDGVYRAESLVDGDAADPEPMRVHVEVEIAGDQMRIDFSGCSRQRPGGSLHGRTYAGAYIAYKAITLPLEPVNEGSFAALDVVIPEGSMMMATYPILMSEWSTALPTVVDTVWRALQPAMPDRIPAGSSGAFPPSLVFFGQDADTGRHFLAQSIEGGGWGGRPHADGQSASVCACQGDVRNAPIETLELKTPQILIEERALRRDSGGPGASRGGLGTSTRIRSLVPGRWNFDRSCRTVCLPWGLEGGETGEPEETLIKLPDADFEQVHDAGQRAVPEGTVVVIHGAGGGGWGAPRERDPVRVAADVREGRVSAQAARERYGVALDGEGEPDLAATAALRAAGPANVR